MNLDSAALFKFLKSLQANNTKEFMDENRKTYTELRTEFIEFLTDVLAGLAKFDNSVANVTAKSCLFRINRDIRFSTNKDLYKTCFSAFLAKGGSKGGWPGYYIHLEPGNKSMLAGGIYMPPPPVLGALRADIALRHRELTKIAQSKNFRSNWGAIDGDSLKTAPKGYSADHPAIEWLRLKSYTVAQALPENDLCKGLDPAAVVKDFRTLFPLNAFLAQAIRSLPSTQQRR
jgi:uncharacterized protein (TIGR02453 family)